MFEEGNMRKLTVFNTVSMDGYFADTHSDMSWAHKQDPEWNAWVNENASGGGVLMFGRVTYDLMTMYWPTPMAAKNNPIVARRMNEMPKIVVSRTMDQPRWNNTTLIKNDLATSVRRLKQQPGDDICILGSGSIIAQLAPERLIDAYQLVVSPIILGNGKTLFSGVNDRLGMKLASTRAFSNGNVLLCYEAA
jgi:dihydrofolate reductase